MASQVLLSPHDFEFDFPPAADSAGGGDTDDAYFTAFGGGTGSSPSVHSLGSSWVAVRQSPAGLSPPLDFDQRSSSFSWVSLGEQSGSGAPPSGGSAAGDLSSSFAQGSLVQDGQGPFSLGGFQAVPGQLDVHGE